MAAILVVDDEQAIRFLLSEVLAKDGHRVTAVADGDAALERLRVTNFDLVITDLHMHDVDGIAVLRAAIKKPVLTEVLILTGHGTVSSAVEAMRLGAFEYLTKPIDLEELRLKVRQALERREMRLQIEAQRREIQAHQQMIARDLKLAAQVQLSLVPRPFRHPRVEVDVHHLPMIGVGGDFSDVYFDGNDHLHLSLVDVTGHGITAALLVNRMSSEIRRLVREHLEPKALLHQFNDFIVESFAGTGMFLTMFTCMLQLSRGQLVYAGSAHPAAILWRRATKSFEKLESQNPIVGFERMANHQFKHDLVEVHPGDKLILYTDGITEAEGANGAQLGIGGLIDFLMPVIAHSTAEVCKGLVEDIKKWAKKPLRDDIYLLVAGLK
ncbi:MAG: SpoIIE family protein phosphatase [candidate division KSB1 bacterium]|nr:SpoIIE family protein phosphatase [candidate division KSB1 bacterium]MDZ7300524.1 SpoIIE family protein phosphatase [candidate division KSB1 bacterium]MDZ7309663.1 SpoIIE family protein phosphatase [candidate division KSB1 bacterium]